jgi:hypothetical protein
MLVPIERRKFTVAEQVLRSILAPYRLRMIEKISGRVSYAVMTFGGFLGLGQEEHAIPWHALTYDTQTTQIATID